MKNHEQNTSCSRVAVAEVLYPKGHKRLNKKYIDLLSSVCNVVLFENGDYFKEIDRSKIESSYQICRLRAKRGEILKTLCHAFNLAVLARRLKRARCDKVILLSFHVKAFSLVKKLYSGISVATFHHYELDRMRARKDEEEAFKQYCGTIHHCVLEDFIANGLGKRYSIDNSLIHVINTPIDIPDDMHNNQIDELMVLGIGQALDDAIVEQLINADVQGLMNNIPCRIVLRTNRDASYCTHIETVSGFLDADTYDSLYKRANACLITYPSTYDLRASGSIDDAFSKKKPVILSSFPAGKSYANEYPNNSIIFNNISDLLEVLRRANFAFDEDEGQRFFKVHNPKNVKRQLQNLIVKMDGRS